MARLTAAQRNKIPASKFAGPKDRRFPIQDAAHIRAARSYERFATPAERRKIDAAARSHGIGQKGKKR